MLGSLIKLALMIASVFLLFTQSIISATTITRNRNSDVEYHVFQSVNNPNYSVRFVNPTICDPNVTQYSGYLDMGPNSHYFFWFFESKSNKPASSPLTAWLNGGPGCSSMIGLWQENGPCRSENNGTQIAYNPYTWTHYSNMLFIDQPNGVGYSYGTPPAYTVGDGAQIFYNAIQLFYEAFPKYSQLPFHLFGESFAGRYIPHYADHIVKQNLHLQQAATDNAASLKVIPIESVGIGNGWINPLLQFKHAANMACSSSYGPLVTQKVCDKMKQNYLYCAKLVENCYKSDGKFACLAADKYCAENIDGLFDTSGRNYYDIRLSANVISPPEDYVRILNHPDFQKEIGVESVDFEECADAPYEAMSNAGEGARDSSPALASLLNSGIRVLNYVGDADYLCNWYGNYEVMATLNFTGSAHYNNQTLKPWLFLQQEVGQIKSTEQLTFLRMYQAGHEVPYYQPKNSLAMFYKWINRQQFSTK